MIHIQAELDVAACCWSDRERPEVPAMSDGPREMVSLDRVRAVASTEELAQLLRHLRRRQARRRRGPEQTYRELAARTGWSLGILAGYFGGRVLPPTDRFDVLVTLLDATPAEQGALATARDRAHERRRQPAPARSRLPVPRQLPAAGFRLAGRQRHLEDLDGLVGVGRTAATGTIAMLSGTAGVGKTSLAVHWAHRVADRFPDGQLFVDLRGFDPDRPPVGPAEAVRDLLDAFGLDGRSIPDSDAAQVGLYRSVLAGLRVLVILDNARDADQVRPLLPGAPGCLTLVTSRNQLTGLVAVDGAHPLVLAPMPVAEARELLAHRLGRDRVAAEPEEADEIAVRCARLPLALAVVAARAVARPDVALADVAGELRRAHGSLDPFTGDDTAADTRAAFACSYQHLSGPAAALFRSLAGHPGPDLTAPAAASLTGVRLDDATAALAELAHAHLLTEWAPGRWVTHDLLRAFAGEQARRLDSVADRRSVVRRGLDHYLHAAHDAAALTHPGRDTVAVPPAVAGVMSVRLPDREAALSWFDSEHRVLIAAVRAAATAGFAAHAWQLAWTLVDFLDWRGHWADLAAVQRLALDAAVAAGDRVGQAQARRGLARADNRLGRYAEAHHELELAIELCQAIGDPATEARCHLNLALTLEHRGRHRRALDHALRGLDLFRAAGHRTGYADSLGIVGWYHTLLGDHERALVCCARAVALQRELGHRYGLPSTLDSLGRAYHNLGRHAEAAVAYRRAIDLYRDAGDRYHQADTLVHLGDCLHVAGAGDEAVRVWRRALEILDGLGHPAAEVLRPRCRIVPG
jgi:tetratricopeptide (TPR) repeat protein